ncbi:alpha/beta hydrolase [Terrimonas sp.]|uniref:alpha/beta fold hydrolase n=1 Tax=Terrimonas sp. TaxID=1914338 RepID=UPI000D510DA5|nr:alpha/beta hydrolase [Terrimonas sp.]PVD52945.1 alpha/beta hydrolase [Terrimonas sp.]
MSRHYINYNNCNICYRKTGSGPYVVLIHGFGEDGSIWRYQEAFLKNNSTLIIPDIPGSGKSAVMDQGDTKDAKLIETYADIIKKIIDAELIETCAVIGHSMGGYIALAFAEKFPEKLNSLGLFHSTAYADTAERKDARRKGIAFIQKHGAHEFLKQSIPNLFGDAFKQSHPELVQQLIEAAGNFSSEALVQYYKAMMERPDKIDILKKVSKPVLFIVGEDDKSVYLQDSLSQCYLPGKSLVNIYPSIAHMGMWEAKNQANATLMKFLNYSSDAVCS